MHATRQTTQAIKPTITPAINLAVFDFDHTLCRVDSFTGFIFFALRKRHIVREGLKMLPWIKAYYAGIYPPHKIRPKLFRQMFQGANAQQVQTLAQQYQTHLIRNLDVLMWQQVLMHRERGDRVVVVSASVDVYLKPFCEQLGIELLCSQTQIQDGVLTGRYVGADCSGFEKAKRIQTLLNLQDYATVYAYGNSVEDREMLALADVAYWHGRGNALPLLIS